MSSYFAIGAGWPIMPLAMSLCHKVEKRSTDRKLFYDRKFIHRSKVILRQKFYSLIESLHIDRTFTH